MPDALQDWHSFRFDMRSLHIDRIAVDSARGVVLEIRGGDSGFFVGLHEAAIFYICRMNGEAFSGDFSHSRLRKASCRCKGKRAACVHRLLIVDVRLHGEGLKNFSIRA